VSGSCGANLADLFIGATDQVVGEGSEPGSDVGGVGVGVSEEQAGIGGEIGTDDWDQAFGDE